MLFLQILIFVFRFSISFLQNLFLASASGKLDIEFSGMIFFFANFIFGLPVCVHMSIVFVAFFVLVFLVVCTYDIETIKFNAGWVFGMCVEIIEFNSEEIQRIFFTTQVIWCVDGFACVHMTFFFVVGGETIQFFKL